MKLILTLLTIMLVLITLILVYASHDEPKKEYTGAYTNGVVIDTEFYDANPVPPPIKSNDSYTSSLSIGKVDSCGRMLYSIKYIPMYPLDGGDIAKSLKDNGRIGR